MAAIRVDDISAGSLDSTGSPIVMVYAKVSSRYAIYRTAEQLMIQFADDDLEGVNQRAALAPLAGLRGQINGLIDLLRAQPSAHHQTKATEYSRRLAYALAVALQGDVAQASAEMISIRDDLTEDRASEARARHLLYAAVATALLIVIARFLSSGWFTSAFGAFEPGISPRYWNAAAVGALGAFFSIALQIRSRQVSIDLQSWDNIGDATLRIFVGATSAVILIALLSTELVDLVVADRPLISTTHGLIIAAFAAGFAERLVADFLSGFSVLGRRSGTAVAPPAAAAAAAGSELTVAGGGAVPAALADRAPTVTGIPVVTNAEHAVEPDDDESDVPGQQDEEAVHSTDGVPAGPVG